MIRASAVLLAAAGLASAAKPLPTMRPTPPAPVPAPETPEVLAAGGFVLEPSGRGARVLAALPNSSAQALGLREGDVLLRLNGSPADPASANKALCAWEPRTRLWAVVQRGLGIESLSTPPAPARNLPARNAERLTPAEEQAAKAHREAALREVPRQVQAQPALSFRIAMGERLWVRFPKGIPAVLAAGDVLEGITSAAMATDSKLDFIGIPAGSAIWAHVLSLKDSRQNKLVKLHVYKIRLKDGRTYPCSGLAVGVSGDTKLVKVNPEGELVASMAEDTKLLLEPQRSLMISFLEPFTVYEKPEFYAAGPGLWIKTAGDELSPVFDITHVIARRSAEYAGLKPGDQILAIDGTPAKKLDFEQAITRLYGKAGTKVKVRVLRAGHSTFEDFSLIRGVAYEKGLGLKTRREENYLIADPVYPESPASRAGLKTGDHLLNVGDLDLPSLSDKELTETLSVDLVGNKELLAETPGRKPRRLSMAHEPFPSPIPLK